MKTSPLLLISGWAHEETALLPIADKIAEGSPVVSLSLASLKLEPDAGEAVSACARSVAAHLDKWGEPACVVGWSAGAMAAIETAARYPAKVSRLVLLSATARFCSEDGYAPGVKPAVLRAMIQGLRKNPQTVVSDFISKALYPLNVPHDLLAQRTQAALASGPDSLAEGLQYLRRADLRPLLPSLALPCLMLHGARDLIVPWQAGRYLEENLPLSRFELLPSAGHCLVEQCADQLVHRIARFVEHL